MFDNTRVKYAGYAGGILFVILIISQLPSEFIQRFIPWLLSSAVLVGGSVSWWKIKAKLDLRYQPARLGPDAALYEKFVNEFSNHFIASAYVVITLFLVLLAGRTALYFFGKTTLGTAQDASVLLVEKTANLTTNAAESIGSSVKYLVNGASTFDVNLDPKDADYRGQYSLLGGSSGTSSSGAPDSTSGPTFASTGSGSAPAQSAPAAAPVQSAPAQPEPQSAAQDAPQASMAAAEYSVQPGDTLGAIAKRYGVSWEVICAANAGTLKSCDNIRSNQKLIIPAAATSAEVAQQMRQQAITQLNTLAQSGQLVATGNQTSAQATMSYAPRGWSTVNGIVTRDDYNTALQNSSQATTLPAHTQSAGEVASWSVIK